MPTHDSLTPLEFAALKETPPVKALPNPSMTTCPSRKRFWGIYGRLFNRWRWPVRQAACWRGDADDDPSHPF